MRFDQSHKPSELAAALTAQRDDLASRASEMGGFELMHAYSDLTDAFVRRVYDLAIEETAEADASLRACAAEHVGIAAVGGYGRREMSPFSDVDVAFIAVGEDDEAVDQVVKRAFRILMDVVEMAGLKVGYSYRRVDDVENLPLDTQTALLDARLITGSAPLFDTFEQALRKAIAPAAFVVGHVDTRATRDPRAETPFVVEPDIKEGHGGLRDLHTARWIAQIALGVDRERVWDGLRARGVLSDVEIDEALAAAEFAARARNALHLLTGRGQDTLSASRHAQVAEHLGFGGAIEFISTYYRHAHVLWRIYRKVTAACWEVDLQIEPGVVARDGKLHILDRGLLCREPASILRVFQHAQSYHLDISRDASDQIISASRNCTLTPDAAHTLVHVLSGAGAGASVRSMAEMGVLQAVVPQFADLMYLVPADAAHQFTVGEHSLRAVEELEALLNEPNEQYADIFSRIQNLDVLFLATLLHDIGKLDSGGEHSKTGAFRALEIAAGLGMPEELCKRVEFLVRHHLCMAETARLRDLQQPKTIRDFTAVVADQQLLDMLFLLTVADSRSVGTRHWSQVQIRFLLELHERAYAALRSPDAGAPDIERHRTRVRRELSLANLPMDEVDEHCVSMPASYLLNTPPEDLAAHIGYVRSVREGSPVVELKDDRAGQFTLLTVVANDQPGLLSRIAGVLHALNIDIHAARIFTRRSTDEIAIDTLYTDFEGRQLTEMKKWQLESELMSVLSGAVNVDDLLSRWRKTTFSVAEEITVRALENLSDHETVIEVRTSDRPGLLHYLTRRISELGLDIHNARVATWGHEVRDVFYVTNRDGSRMSAEQLTELQTALSG